MKPVVFIHTNNKQLVPAIVGAHALKSRSRHSDKFEVRFLRVEDTPYLWNRENQRFIWWEGKPPCIWRRQDLQTFQCLRRLVPEIMGFEGTALVIDPDMFAVGDVYDLLARDMDGKAILCCRKQEFYRGRQLYSSAVMLLDCSKLKHWRWHRDIDDIFTGKMKLGYWLALLDEDPERIGVLEDDWNQPDILNDRTRFLHNTEKSTQPWKTGLPADFDHYVQPLSWRNYLGRLKRQFFSPEWKANAHYRPHPDPQQERLFFTLLKECLEQGDLTRELLQDEIAKKHLRSDALAIIDALGAPCEAPTPHGCRA